MQSLFFLITTRLQKGINRKISFNKHLARKYIRTYTRLLNLIRSRPQYSGIGYPLLQTYPKSDQRLGLDGAHKEGRAPCWKMAAELTQCQNIIFREITLSLLHIFP